jgi:hypothetical protein
MATTIAVYYRFIMFVELSSASSSIVFTSVASACSYRPAYNLAIKAVDNRRQIDFSSRKLELRNIGQPLSFGLQELKSRASKFSGAGPISPQ